MNIPIRMKRYGVPILLGAILIGATVVSSPMKPRDDIFLEKRFERKSREFIIKGEYLLFLPGGYSDSSKPFPLILFLHGASSKKMGYNRLKTKGPAPFIETRPDFPFILISPSCPLGGGWSVGFLGALLDEVTEKYRVDQDRIYVTGISMGGFGTWRLALAFPHRFAAIAPVAGAVDLRRVCDLKNLPVWIMHGAIDEQIPPHVSEQAFETLRACGGDVNFTLFKDSPHDCSDKAYGRPDLYEWFLTHRRQSHRRGTP